MAGHDALSVLVEQTLLKMELIEHEGSDHEGSDHEASGAAGVVDCEEEEGQRWDGAESGSER